MPQANVLALHSPETVTVALEQAVACVEAAKVPKYLCRDAFVAAFGALTAREVVVSADQQLPASLADALRMPQG